MEEIIGVRIDQMEDCKRAVEHLANENGFATVIRRSTKKDPQTGIYLKFELVCTRSRQPELKGSGKRRTPSGRVGCQWKGYIAFYKRENTWKFNVQRDFHNHYRVNAERIPVIRRHKRNGNVEVLNQIRALNNNRRLTAQDIAEEVGRQYSLEVTAKDVQNIRDEDQRALLGGRTPTQQVLHNLQNDMSEYSSILGNITSFVHKWLMEAKNSSGNTCIKVRGAKNSGVEKTGKLFNIALYLLSYLAHVLWSV